MPPESNAPLLSLPPSLPEGRVRQALSDYIDLINANTICTTPFDAKLALSYFKAALVHYIVLGPPSPAVTLDLQHLLLFANPPKSDSAPLNPPSPGNDDVPDGSPS